MAIYLDADHIVWREFGSLEPFQEQWRTQVGFWETYAAALFQSNGLAYRPEDSNVQGWLHAEDRAPFVNMVEALLPEIRARADLSAIDLLILAHWLPDIHLGTSVTNFTMHHLGLRDCLGFAISDHGVSAPLFALHCIDRYLSGRKGNALLLTMDQKHLLYRSKVVEDIDPANSAGIVLLTTDPSRGHRYAGYHRRISVAPDRLDAELASFSRTEGLGRRPMTLIATPEVLRLTSLPGERLEIDSRLLCTAPFARLAGAMEPGRDYLLVTYEDDCLCAVGLAAAEASP